MKARIKFRKYGVMRFIGHLDVMRYFQKAMRRAEIPIAFTGGYSPHMIMSFAQPLGVGVTSDGEYLDIELKEDIDPGQAIRQLNEVMVEGMEVVGFNRIPDDKKSSGMTIVAAASYRVTLLESVRSADVTRAFPDSWEAKIEGFLNQKHIVVLKRTKRSEADQTNDLSDASGRRRDSSVPCCGKRAKSQARPCNEGFHGVYQRGIQ